MRPSTLAAARRTGWLAAGLALGGFAVFEVVKHGLGPLPILVFGVLPDLAFLVGLGDAHAPGQLPSRAVPAYNALHHPVPALVLVAAASFGLLPLPWFAGGLAWLAHIALDRAAGYGPRTAEGWQRG